MATQETERVLSAGLTKVDSHRGYDIHKEDRSGLFYVFINNGVRWGVSFSLPSIKEYIDNVIAEFQNNKLS